MEKFTLPFGPIAAGSNAEWSFDRTRLGELEHLARSSGGTERLDLEDIWRAPRQPAFRDLRPWLLGLLLALFVVDALLTRLGVKWPQRQSGLRGDSDSAESPGPVGGVSAFVTNHRAGGNANGGNAS